MGGFKTRRVFRGTTNTGCSTTGPCRHAAVQPPEGNAAPHAAMRPPPNVLARSPSPLPCSGTTSPMHGCSPHAAAQPPLQQSNAVGWSSSHGTPPNGGGGRLALKFSLTPPPSHHVPSGALGPAMGAGGHGGATVGPDRGAGGHDGSQVSPRVPGATGLPATAGVPGDMGMVGAMGGPGCQEGPRRRRGVSGTKGSQVT